MKLVVGSSLFIEHNKKQLNQRINKNIMPKLEIIIFNENLVAWYLQPMVVICASRVLVRKFPNQYILTIGVGNE